MLILREHVWRRMALAAGVGALALGGSLSGQARAADPPRFADTEFAPLLERWAALQSTLAVPGYAVVVVRGDEVISLEGFGMADLEAGRPVTPDTMFYIASATKPFTALLAQALVDDGKLDIDRPVREYLPRLELPDAELTQTLTTRDLLCHRYGVGCTEITFADAFTGFITDDLYFRALPRARIRNEVAYSNVHLTLVGRVVESVAGKSWRDALAERILGPAGMTRTTGYASRMYADPDCAVPYVRVDGRRVPSAVRKTDRTMHAAGGLGTTARDLGRWLRLHLNYGVIDGRRVVSADRLREMYSEHSQMVEPRGPIRIENAFGLTWMKGALRDREPLYGHGGGYAGGNAYIGFMPNEKIGVAILVNCIEGFSLSQLIAIDVFDKLLGNPADARLLEDSLTGARQTLARPSRKPSGPNPAQDGTRSAPLANYVGTFASEWFGVLTIELRDGRLTARIGDLPLDLFSNGVDRLWAWAEPDMRFGGRFEMKDGSAAEVVLQQGEGPVMRFIRR